MLIKTLLELLAILIFLLHFLPFLADTYRAFLYSPLSLLLWRVCFFKTKNMTLKNNTGALRSLLLLDLIVLTIIFLFLFLLMH